MDINERFNQIESLLVDLARKVDRQGEILAQHSGILAQHGEILAQHGEILVQHSGILSQHTSSMARQEKLLTIVSEQADGIIEFLKLSEARHTQAEQRQDTMLVEIQRQGQRLDASVEAVKVLLKRQESTDARLDAAVQTQLQMLQLLRLDADKVDELTRRTLPLEGQEPRIKRLEDEVFRAAS